MSRPPLRAYRGKVYRCADPLCGRKRERDAFGQWRIYKCDNCGLDMYVEARADKTEVVGLTPEQATYIRQNLDGAGPGEVLFFLGVAESL